MCGWDTDCNAGNAANIAGVLQGVKPHWARWRPPINDILTLSGVTGAFNIVDLPSAARDLAVLALCRRGDAAPAGWGHAARDRGVLFDFALPGATHGFRAEGSHRLRTVPGLTAGALDFQIDRWAEGDTGRVVWKSFYRRSDYGDDRYRPMLSPVAASGQRVTISLMGSEAMEGPREVEFAPCVRLSASGEERLLGDCAALPADWTEIAFDLPVTDDAVGEIGLRLIHRGAARVLIYVGIRRFSVSGPARTRIDPTIEAEEWGSVSRFSFNRGRWGIDGGRIVGRTDTDADLWTGHPNATDQRVTAVVEAIAGDSHLVTLRTAGARRFYAGEIEGGRAAIRAEDFGDTLLAETPVGRHQGGAAAGGRLA